VASIQRIVSPRTQEVTYRVQVRPKGREPESATFPNLKEAKAWAISVEAALSSFGAQIYRHWHGPPSQQ
jgi:hypothetical protein